MESTPSNSHAMVSEKYEGLAVIYYIMVRAVPKSTLTFNTS